MSTAMSDYFGILIALLCLLLLCRWTFKAIISPVTNWPVVGMLPDLLYKSPQIHEFTTQLLKQHNGTFVFKGPWFSNMNILLTSDPSNVRYISTQNFSNYQKGPEYKKIFEPFGDGVLNSNMESWKLFRKMIQSMIKDNKFQNFLERSMRDKVAKGLIPVLDNVSKHGTVVDLQDLFVRFTFDNICSLVLGFDPNSLSVDLPEVAYKSAFDDVEEAVFYRHIVPEVIWMFQKLLVIGEEKKLKKAMNIIDSFLEKCISTKRDEYNRRIRESGQYVENKDDYNLITACMIDYPDQMENLNSKETVKYLRDIGFNFIAAGKDTVNSALTWLFWLVCTHPSVKSKIIEEIEANSKDKDEQSWNFFNLDELTKLVYLHATILETLRLYPSVPFNHRASVEEDTLPSGHHIKANARIMSSNYAMGRMEEIWGQDFQEFKPERWISEQGRIIHIPSYKFIAFNTGPRSCLGKDITFVQMKIIVSAILWRYDVQVVEDHPIEPCLSVMMHMKHGLKVRASKRR